MIRKGAAIGDWVVGTGSKGYGLEGRLVYAVKVSETLTFDLRQSMKNGGGPACLRLRVALTTAERAAVGARVWLDDALPPDHEAWVRRHYRDRLAPADLADPRLVDEGRRALDELTKILRLPAVYPFQLA